MSRTVCKLISLLTACVLLLNCLAGCGGNHSGITEKQYRKLFEKGAAINNNIEIENIKMSETNARNISYIRINGLKNRSVQDKINSRIYDVIEDMLRMDFIPPYRGINLSLKRYSSSDHSIYIYCYYGFNSNNILSLYADCDVTYENKESNDDPDYFAYSYYVPLTFDLSNGEELTLSDLFDDGADYIELLNRSVDKCLLSGGFDSSPNESGYYTNISMVSPFKSIKPDQKYYIDIDGDICLCIDYSTPEFYTGERYPTWLRLPPEFYRDDMKLYRASDNPLYESETVDCSFMYNYDYTIDRPRDKNGSGMTYYSTYRYLNSAPIKVEIIGRSLAFDNNKLPVSIKDFKKQTVNHLGTNHRIDYSFFVDTRPSFIKSADYYGYEQSTSFYARIDEDYWDDASDTPDSYYLYYNKAYCFDRNGEEIELSSLFVNPEQADSLLTDAIQKYVINAADLYDKDNKFSEEDIHSLVSELIPHINGFTLDSDSFRITYDLSGNELTKTVISYLGITEENGPFDGWVHTANYRDIGCENLVLFGDAFA